MVFFEYCVQSHESKHGSNPVKISSKIVFCCHVTIRHIFKGIKRYLAVLVSGFTLIILNVEKAWELAMIASVLQRNRSSKHHPVAFQIRVLGKPKSITKESIERKEERLKLLSPKSDQHQTSPCNINAL